MDQKNVVLRKEDILQLIIENCNDTFRTLLRGILNSILLAESTAQLQTERYEHSAKRTDTRNGFRSRYLKTRMGKITLKIPRHRNSSFKTKITQNYPDCENAVLKNIAGMAVWEITADKVSQILKMLCGPGLSKVNGTGLIEDFETEIDRFGKHPIGSKYQILFPNSVSYWERVDGKMKTKEFMYVYAITEDGSKEIVGSEIADHESQAAWAELLLSLHSRGFNGIVLLPEDPHEGLEDALKEVYPY